MMSITAAKKNNTAARRDAGTDAVTVPFSSAFGVSRPAHSTCECVNSNFEFYHLKQELQEAQNKIKQLEEQQEKERAEKNAEIQRLSKENLYQATALEELICESRPVNATKSMVQTLTVQNKSLRLCLEASETCLSTARGAKLTQAREIENLSERLRATEAQLDKAHSELAKLSSQMSSSSAHIENLESQLQSSYDRYDEYEANEEALQAKVNLALDAVGRKVNELDELRRSKAAKDSELYESRRALVVKERDLFSAQNSYFLELSQRVLAEQQLTFLQDHSQLLFAELQRAHETKECLAEEKNQVEVQLDLCMEQAKEAKDKVDQMEREQKMGRAARVARKLF